MIFANSTWGLWLEEHGTPGIYRSQRMGRVRMSTSPGPHDGLGVERYAWSNVAAAPLCGPRESASDDCGASR